MTEERNSSGAVPPSSRRGKAFFIFAIALIITLFTGGIAYGTQSVFGVNEKPSEGTVIDGIRTFNITVEQWAFHPAVIKVNPGEKIRFYVKSNDVFHGFAVNELKVNYSIPSDKTVQINTVVPAEAKDQIYSMYCSVFCGIGHPYFKGQIIVGNPNNLIGFEKIMPYASTLVMVVIFAVALVMEKKRKAK